MLNSIKLFFSYIYLLSQITLSVYVHFMQKFKVMNLSYELDFKKKYKTGKPYYYFFYVL